MAKYYVQSGNFRTVISADEAEKAALWAVHKVMEQVLPMADDPRASGNHSSVSVGQSGMMTLGETMLVSEKGFDSSEQLELDTFELQIHWWQLTVALARLEAMVSDSTEPAHDMALCQLVG